MRVCIISVMRHSMTQSKGKNYGKERSSGDEYSDALWVNGGLHDQVGNSVNTSGYYIEFYWRSTFRAICRVLARDSPG